MAQDADYLDPRVYRNPNTITFSSLCYQSLLYLGVQVLSSFEVRNKLRRRYFLSLLNNDRITSEPYQDA